MNKKNKKLWVDALRGKVKDANGKTYNQGMYFLHRDGDYCCLGVACDLFLDTDWYLLNGSTYACGSAKITDPDLRHNGVGWPTVAQLQTLGISLDLADTVANMNDHHKTFDEIADYIEENV